MTDFKLEDQIAFVRMLIEKLHIPQGTDADSLAWCRTAIRSLREVEQEFQRRVDQQVRLSP